jgi:hypothetical protein
MVSLNDMDTMSKSKDLQIAMKEHGLKRKSTLQRLCQIMENIPIKILCYDFRIFLRLTRPECYFLQIPYISL